MKKISTILIIALVLSLFAGCSGNGKAQVAATTATVYQFTEALCADTGISVTRLVTESVSCLHDYSLNVRQMQLINAAEVIVISGGGLEEAFMSDTLSGKNVIDGAAGIELTVRGEEADNHIWMSPVLAKQMAKNICDGLAKQYPEQKDIFESNLQMLNRQFDEVIAYGQQQLGTLSCREMITFHNGFGYFADAFDLTILRSIEEEAGSEASAKQLIELIELVREHQLPAIFTETNGSAVSAHTIKSETGVEVYALDMCMGNLDYFAAMRRNIDTVKEALG
jgi:ABC-type Zn uptake system ZnuABC Zn-binding protein ZnuA